MSTVDNIIDDILQRLKSVEDKVALTLGLERLTDRVDNIEERTRVLENSKAAMIAYMTGAGLFASVVGPFVLKLLGF